MSFDTYLRIFVALCGLFIAGALARSLFTGRISLATRSIVRASDARTYWKTVGINALVVVAVALAIWTPGRLMTPVIFLGIITSQLLTAYLSGEIPWTGGRVFSRAKGDPGFRKVVIFYWVMLAVFSILLITGLLLDRLAS